MGHTGATVGDNSTLSEQGSINHVGQIFFDQDLITQVTMVEPYSSNLQEITLNTDDSIAAQAAEDVDPFVEYSLIGGDLSSGIIAWTTIAVNVSSEQSVSPAAILYAEGGVENAAGSGQGGPGGEPPNGDAPGAGTNGTEVTAATASTESVADLQATSTASPAASSSTSSSGARPMYEWFGSVAAMAASLTALIV
jgi:hypothetical protein